MKSVFVVAMTAALLAAACASGDNDFGPEAPPLPAPATACEGGVCVDYPSDWAVIEQGDGFIRFAHSLFGGNALASVGRVSMTGLAKSAGVSGNPTVSETVEIFWDQVAGGEARLISQELLPDGSVRSEGTLPEGRLWVLIVPLDENDAIGLEVRGPNASWETHAGVFLDSMMVDA